MPYKAVLFDLDGVLVDSGEAWFSLLNATAREFSAPPITREQFRETWGQGVHADVAQFFPHCTLARIERFYNAHFIDHVPHVAVDPDALAVFAALAEAGLSTAVVTNTPAPAARHILTKAGLAPWEVIGGTDVPRPKPAPDMVLLALRRLSVKPEEALMVGDTLYDREAAGAAGVAFVGYGIESPVVLSRLGELLQLLALGDGRPFSPG